MIYLLLIYLLSFASGFIGELSLSVALTFVVSSFEQHSYVEIVSCGDPAGAVHSITFVILLTEYLYEMRELICHPDDGLHFFRVQDVGMRIQYVERGDVHGHARAGDCTGTVPGVVLYCIELY